MVSLPMLVLQVAFIFSDAEVKEEGFLEYINQLLMTGEVSGLFPKDELDAVINDIRPLYLMECPGAFLFKDTMCMQFRHTPRQHLCLCVQHRLQDARKAGLHFTFACLQMLLDHSLPQCSLLMALWLRRAARHVRGAVQLLPGPRARQAARVPVLQPGGAPVLPPRAAVPGAHQRHHHRLVPALA